MPPKEKITKEKIIDAALEIAREHGLEGLSARIIASRLNCSTQPIYSLFENMDEIKNVTYKKAVDLALSYMTNFKKEDNNPKLNLLYGYLHFAKKEKRLYRSLYLSGYKTYHIEKEPFIGEKVTMSILRESNETLKDVSEESLRNIYIQLSIHLIGLGTILNNNTMSLDIDEAANLLIDLYEKYLLSEGIKR